MSSVDPAAASEELAGTARLAGWLFRKTYRLLRPKEITLVECEGSKIYVNPQEEGMAKFLLTSGVFEQHETAFFRSLLRPGMVVTDIGANIGYYTLIASQHVQEAGRVFAFEPDPRNFELLAKSVQVNGYTNVTPINKALSDSVGTIRLFIDRRNFANNSLAVGNVPDSAGTVEVECTTLDEFFAATPHQRPDIIKMDAQGAEGLILAGADRVLSGGPMKVLLEFWPFGLNNVGSDPVEFLRRFVGYGFGLSVIDHAGQRQEGGEPSELVENCLGRAQGTGFLNLLLEK